MKHLVTNRLRVLYVATILTIAAMMATPIVSAQQTKHPAHEAHPVLQRSITQLEGIKDRLQKAPKDFGGHREAAVDAITKAISELQQAEAFDKK